MDNAEAAAAPKAKKKPRKLVKVAMGVVVLGGLAAGGALYAQGAGLIDLPGASADGKEEAHADQPHLVPREDADPENFEVVGARPVEADKFQVSYYPIEEKFTSNLRDEGGFIQIGLGVSTYYDERVLQNLERHEMAVRSAVLMQLADQDPLVIATPRPRSISAALTAARFAP